ncbi:MAG: hypothetical protein AAGF99_07330 [Bacteroidota bacterium]
MPADGIADHHAAVALVEARGEAEAALVEDLSDERGRLPAFTRRTDRVGAEVVPDERERLDDALVGVVVGRVWVGGTGEDDRRGAAEGGAFEVVVDER